MISSKVNPKIMWNDIRVRLKSGRPTCLYDFPDREDETDVVYIGCSVNAVAVDLIRRNVGGPLAVYLPGHFLRRLNILTFPQLITSAQINSTYKLLIKPNRGHDPRYTIAVDARDNLTGSSAFESAHTIDILYGLLIHSASMNDKELRQAFAEGFMAPGHIPIIAGSDGLLKERNGHTELALTIAKRLGLPEIAVAGELIDPVTLKSMTRDTAEKFAQQYEMPFISGDDVYALDNSSGT